MTSDRLDVDDIRRWGESRRPRGRSLAARCWCPGIVANPGESAPSSRWVSRSPPVLDRRRPRAPSAPWASCGQRRYASAAISAAVSRSVSSRASDVATSASTRALSAESCGLPPPDGGEPPPTMAATSRIACTSRPPNAADGCSAGREPRASARSRTSSRSRSADASRKSLSSIGEVGLGTRRASPASALKAGTAQQVLVVDAPSRSRVRWPLRPSATRRAPSASSSSQRSRRGHAVATAS